MVNYYSRYADPRATFVMIEVRTLNDDGRPSQPFHLRVTEEEFENMCANSRRQAQRSQWPPPPHGVRWRVADDHQSRSYPHDAYGYPGFDGPFFTSPQDEYEYYERQRRDKATRDREARDKQRAREDAEHNRREREQREKSREEYFAQFGDAADESAESFFRFFKQATGEDFPTTGERPTPPRSQQQLKERLAELAGSAWIETLDLLTLYKKARRRCHPDMDSGSHELWIELEDIADKLGIVKKKSARR